MENLERDPIVEFYLNFTNSTVQESTLPVFSETLLRLAARHALGPVRPVEAKTLALYRKLILFYFADTYTAVDDLLKIMPCFSEPELIKCFENFEAIRTEWQEFTQSNLVYYIRKKAFFAMLTEWTRRYMQLYDELDSTKLRSQAVKIHRFFNWSTKSVNQWLRSFESNTLKGNWAESDLIQLEEVTEQDLRIAKIVSDMKHQLHPLICKEVEEIFKSHTGNIDSDSEIFQKASNVSPPPSKRRRRRAAKVVDSSPIVNASPEVIHLETDISEQAGDIVHVLEVSDTEPDTNDDEEVIATEIEEVEAEPEAETEPEAEAETEPEAEAEADEETSIINDEKATTYLSALQAYVVVNGLFDAIPLLDRVDSILRAKFEPRKKKTT